MKTRLLIWSVLLVLFHVSSTRSFSYEFEVDGTMIDSPGDHPPFSCSLQIYVRDCQWAVFQIWENPTNRIVTEISDDGDSVYMLERIETNSGVFMPDDYSKALPGGFHGQIHPAHFPFGTLNTEAVTLFYAYASSCYLDAHTNQMIDSIPLQSNDPQSHPGVYAGVGARITRDSPPLGLPRQIIFLRNLQYETNAVLSASEFTNVAGVQVPQKVSLVRYSSNKNEILMTYEFQATRISEKCPLKSFKPLLPTGTHVTDYRVPHFLASDPGSYRPMTNGWPANHVLK